MSLTLNTTNALNKLFCPDNLNLNLLFGTYAFDEADNEELFVKGYKILKDKYLSAFYYIITKIIRKKWNDKFHKQKSYQISAKSFEAGISWRIRKKAIEFLIQLGVVERSGPYIKGVRSFAYRICSPYNEGKIASVQRLQPSVALREDRAAPNFIRSELNENDFADLETECLGI